jgi:chaperonin GroEL (HSP60 family)
MTAKLATVHDRILARVEEAAAVRDGNSLRHRASDKPRVGSLQFGCGYLSPYFVTDPERMEVVFLDAYVLIHEKKISSKSDLIPILEQITKSGKPLVIIAEDIEGEALATLVVNKLRGTLQVAAVKAPGLGDRRKAMLQDIATLTGGKAITEDLGINLKIEDLGQAKKITIDKGNTAIIEGKGKKGDVQGRVKEIRGQIEKTTSDYDREEPLRQIAGNAGEKGAIVLGKVLESKGQNFGYNALTAEYEDLVKAGVLDPTKVVRTALTNPGSIAALMLTTEALVADIKEEAMGIPAGVRGGVGDGS